MAEVATEQIAAPAQAPVTASAAATVAATVAAPVAAPVTAPVAAPVSAAVSDAEKKHSAMVKGTGRKVCWAKRDLYFDCLENNSKSKTLQQRNS